MKTQTSPSKFQIIGAGFAGLSLGIKLRELGHEVRISERLPAIPRQVCGEYLAPEGVKVVRELGLGFALKGFRPVLGMKLIAPNGGVVDTTFPERALGLSLNRQIVLERLAQKFKTLGGELHFAESDVSEQFDYVIGADGRQSKTARYLGLDHHTIMDEKRVAVHCYLKALKPLERKGEMHIFGDGSYIGVNPISHDEVNVSIVLSANVLQQHSDAKAALNYYLTHSKRLSEIFAQVTNEEVRTAFPLGRKAGAIASARGCLIGDAAGFIDPLTGEGMTSALKTVKILVEELSQNTTVPAAFLIYARRRVQEFQEKESLNHAFQKIIRSTTLCNLIALILSRSERLRNTFIGVIGNVYTPKGAIKVMAKNYLEAHHG